MIRRTVSRPLLALMIGFSCPVCISAQDDPVLYARDAPRAEPRVVHVDLPTGEKETDRANIQAAFDAVRPGDTVQFAPGTYLLGAGARLTAADVTVLGHPEGTVLRGCDPEAFSRDESELVQIVFGCTGLYVQAERQSIRGLTFEYTWHGIVVGPYPTTVEDATALRESGAPPPAYPAGGQRIEGNIFRATPNGLRVLGTGNERSVVRDNDFIDVFHAIGIYGAPLHFLDNRVTVAEPERVPFSRHPGSAVIVSPGHTDCAGHVVAGNRIEGYPDPIYVLVGRGETCHGVEIRGNTIHAARVKIPEAWIGATPTAEDSTMVGAPITLMNRKEPMPGPPGADRDGILEDILVQGNHIVGAEGLGILVQGVSRSRIAGNTIAGIQRRSPFPGVTWDGFDQRWEAANGSAIWLSPGSDENEVAGNDFEDIAGAAVFVEGDNNVVERLSASDSVRDLGTANRVIDGEQERASPAYAERLAEQVVIYRDTHGVPHVHGPTDEAAVFGLAYARAEDQFELIEDIFISRLGRSSEIYGEEGLLTPGHSEKGHDLFVHAFGYLDEARSAYHRLPAKIRSLVDAYAAGLNYYLDRNPEQQVRLLERFEPWWVVAVEDFSESHRGRVHSGAFEADAATVMRGEWLLPERGSNTWAISPSKTADGHAMLLMNPHDPSGRPYYECHIMSDEGLNSYGVMNHFGTLLLPYIGFNEHLGWSVTINQPDLGDAFVMSFDDPGDSARYRFGDAYLTARTREATIRVRTDTGVVARNVMFTETIHGPVLAKSEDGRPLSFRIARAPSGTWTEQLYRMHRARNLEEWKAAVALRGLTYHNLMYADAAGNIFYLYNGNVPVRDDAFDWTAPVDGSDPRTLWQGYHGMHELPQLLNPRTGYLQNANSSPFVTTHAENPAPADFPRYMTNLENDDTFRAQRSRELLRSAEATTLDSLQRMIMSTYVHAADEWLPQLFDEWARLGEDRSDLRERLREAIAALRTWDRESDAGSFETTLFVLWDEVYWTLWPEEYEVDDREDPELPLLVSLAGALDVLEREFGTWQVPWREVFRHQRTADDNAVAWDEDRPSYETSANHGRYGTMLNMSGAAYDGARGSVKRRMTFGNSFVSIVEFTNDGPIARSIVAYGNSMRPESPHYDDQAEMFARGLMKPVFFRMEDILANLEESYRPGEVRQGSGTCTTARCRRARSGSTGAGPWTAATPRPSGGVTTRWRSFPRCSIQRAGGSSTRTLRHSS